MLLECCLCGLYIPSCCRWALIDVGTPVGGIDLQVYRLWKLAITSVWAAIQELTPWNVLHPIRLWCLPRSPFWHVACEANQVMFCYALKPSTHCSVSGDSWVGLLCRKSSATAYDWSRTACARPRGVRERSRCESRYTITSTRLGQLSKRPTEPQGLPLSAFCPLCSASWRALSEMVGIGFVLGWVSGIHQYGVYSVQWVNADSYLMLVMSLGPIRQS